jgi:hypothetical protein
MSAACFGSPQDVPFVPKPFDMARLFATLAAALVPPVVPRQWSVPLDTG